MYFLHYSDIAPAVDSEFGDSLVLRELFKVCLQALGQYRRSSARAYIPVRCNSLCNRQQAMSAPSSIPRNVSSTNPLAWLPGDLAPQLQAGQYVFVATLAVGP